MAHSVIAAEFTNGGKTTPATLTICQIHNGERTFISRHNVSGKRDARYMAKELNATPWNF